MGHHLLPEGWYHQQTQALGEEKIQKVLDERGVAYDFVQSETADSVERLTKMMVNNGYKTIIIVGGDSALNDAVNCLMMEEKEVRESISLGVIPNGIMNDFAHFWEIDGDKIEETVDFLIKHHPLFECQW